MTMRRLAAIGMTARSTVVVLSLTAWFLLSNHCALGLSTGRVETTAPAEEGGCPMHSGPAKQKPETKIPCCKDVRAVVGKSVANALPFSLRYAAPCDYAAEIFGLPPRVSPEIDGSDTGPPNCFSFAESVLQESTFAHAPPVPETLS